MKTLFFWVWIMFMMPGIYGTAQTNYADYQKAEVISSDQFDKADNWKLKEDNQELFLASQQLFDSFRLAVINNSLAIPQDGVIAETGDEGGDFVFIKKK